MKHVSVVISVGGPAGWSVVSKTWMLLMLQKISDTIIVMSIKLYLMVLLIEFYLSIEFLVAMIIFQSHNSVRQF